MDTTTSKLNQDRGRFITAFHAKPVEMLAAFGMLIAGVAVSLAGTGPWWSAGGAALTALAGVLFSWSMASLNTNEQAAAILRPQLETTSKHLGTVSGQIARAIQAVHNGYLDSDTGFALMLQANGTLYNLVSDLQRLTGTQFDSTDLVDTIERLDELAGKISRLPERAREEDWQEEESSELREEIEGLKQQLQSQLALMGRPAQARHPVRVTCPSCAGVFNAPLGANQGDSAMPTCPICASRFHVHRGSDGSFFVRQPGSTVAPTILSQSSPQQIDEYASIIDRQGLKLPPVAIREQGFSALAAAFRVFPNGVAPSWDDLDTALMQVLEDAGLCATAVDAKRIRQGGYRTRIYDMSDGTGIRLREGVDEKNLYAEVALNLASRIYQNLDDEIDPSRLAVLLFGDPKRASESAAIIERLKSVQGSPAVHSAATQNETAQQDVTPNA